MQNYVENFGKNVIRKFLLENWLEELGGKIVWKEWLKNVVDNSVEKVVGQIRWKSYVEICCRKIVLKNGMEQLNCHFLLLEKLDDQFGEQIYWEIWLNNQVHKLSVNFGEIIGLQNIVE